MANPQGLIPAAHATAGVYNQGLVQPTLFIDAKPSADGDARLETVGVSLQVDLLVLSAAPQSLDKDVVQPGPAAIQGDPYPNGSSVLVKRHPGELRPLDGVEDLRPGERVLFVYLASPSTSSAR
jgi:hypothetical protein